MLEVRFAMMEDIEAMVELGKAGHALSNKAKYTFNEMGAKLLAAQCICNKRLCAFVAVEAGRVVGVLLGAEEECPYLKMKIASDIVTYAASPGAGRKLLERFSSWALDERRVDQLILGVTSGNIKGTTALYRRLGFTQVGGMFTKEKPCQV